MMERMLVSGISLKAAPFAAGAAGGGAGAGAAVRSPDLSEPWTPEPLPAQQQMAKD